MRILLIGAGEDEKLRAALRRGQVSFDGQAAGLLPQRDSGRDKCGVLAFQCIYKHFSASF